MSTMSKLIQSKAVALFELMEDKYLNSPFIERKDLLDLINSNNFPYPTWYCNDPHFKAGRGRYSVRNLKDIVFALRNTGFIPVSVDAVEDVLTQPNMKMTEVSTIQSQKINVLDMQFVPSKARGYVSFGNFSDVRNIISSKMFYPTYITGLSGNGKTMMVEQACANEGRECIRVNVTIETDEDDLLGGFRLLDGKTVWHDGPAITAMERGAILLLDEVDLGSNKLMCMQPILEGNGVFLKKIAKYVKPKSGFNVFATANTKGQGSDDGKFIGTNIMNEAFLERFSITMEQDYPSAKVEQRILANVMKNNGKLDQSLIDLLVNWAGVIRKSFAEGAVSEIISTRRLVHIVEAYHIFGSNTNKALTMCLNRFESDTKKSFLDLFDKLNPANAPPEIKMSTVNETILADKEITF